MKGVFCCIIGLAVLSMVQGCQQEEAYKAVREKEFSELARKENTIVLDVRTPEEYKEAHLENAVLLNYKSENFQTEVDQLDKTKTYLVYCKAGGRSGKACEVLSEKGIKTYHLEGGISNWKGRVAR